MSITNTYWSSAIGDDTLILSSDIRDAYEENHAYGDYEDTYND